MEILNPILKYFCDDDFEYADNVISDAINRKPIEADRAFLKAPPISRPKRTVDLSSPIVAVRNENRKGGLLYKVYISALLTYFLKKTVGRYQCLKVNSLVGGFNMKRHIPRVPDYMKFGDCMVKLYFFCDKLNMKFKDYPIEKEEKWKEKFDKIVEYFKDGLENNKEDSLIKEYISFKTEFYDGYKKFRGLREKHVGFPCLACYGNFVKKYHKLNITYEYGYYQIHCLRCKYINYVPKNAYIEIFFAIYDLEDDIY